MKYTIAKNIVISLELLAVLAALCTIGVLTLASNTTLLAPSSQAEVARNEQTVAAGSRYVALGDSYAAGSGANRTPYHNEDGEFMYFEGHPCPKSRFSAPNILAQWDQLMLTDATCGGAQTEDILDRKQRGNVPQIERVTGDTKLITMLIGANDIRLMGLSRCIQSKDCTKRIEKTSVTKFAKQAKKIVAELADKAPQATILMTGYPLIFPAPGNDKGTCKDFLSDSEQSAIYKVLLELNDAIRDAADTSEHAIYVDPLASSSPFMRRDKGFGRDSCSPSLFRGMNGPLDGPTSSWHPNIFGQQYYNELYRQALRPLPASRELPEFVNPLSLGL